MRDVKALAPLLARAALQAQETPRYRFWGTRNPANRQKRAVLNADPKVSTVKDGVAKLYLYEPIDSWGGYWGVSALEFLEALDTLGDDVETIELHINCPGGEVWDALAILNSLRQHDAKVVAVVDGIAASAASFIAVAADETVMAPNSQLMIHDAIAGMYGNASDFRGLADLLDQVSDNIADVYATKAGTATAEWRAVMKDEGWYTAAEAVEVGLADKVLGDEETDEPEDDFDLKGVGAKHTSRADAPPPAARAGKPVSHRDNEREARFWDLARKLAG